MKTLAPILALLVVAQASLAAGPTSASTAPPRIVNIINFIRGVEPRNDTDLLEPVRQQIRLAHQYNLPTTFLVQYDAMLQERFVDLLRNELTPGDEIGAWLEVVQPQVEAAGLKWHGRYPWDWHADVGFTIGYAPAERERLIDVYMRQFKKTFGREPRSVGCWLLDAPTLAYLADKYGVTAACVCKDQTGTDGYTLWGGYWNQAYYPSRRNGFMPAQSAGQQIPIPVFRMLGSDPIYQYDTGLGQAAQGVVTLEPVYTGGDGGGGRPEWVRWFFDTTFSSPCLAFAYTQVGQENSFDWPAMEKGLTDQVQLVAELAKSGKVRVDTLGESGRWFREHFPQTPATAVVAMKDWKKEGRASVWYDSRYYRVNLFWDQSGLRIRDLHLFDERYPERYLTERVSTHACTYDTLPILDGFNWSTPQSLAGIRLVRLAPDGQSEPTPLQTGQPEVTQVGPETLVAAMPFEGGGKLEIRCEPAALSFKLTGQHAPNRALQLSWAAGKAVPIVKTEPDKVLYRHNGFDYALRCAKGKVNATSNANAITLLPANGVLSLDMNGGAGSLQPSSRPASDLRLELEMTPARITCSDDVTAIVNVVNAGSEPARFFKPEHFNEHGPRNLRFIRSDGKAFAPPLMPFQSAATEGVLGEVLEIRPGEKVRLMKARLRLFAPTDGTRADPFPLPPGEYRAVFSFVQPDETVPFQDNRSWRKRIEGLWTGSLKSNEAPLSVGPRTEPYIVISGTTRGIKVDEPCPLQVEIGNPTSESLRLTGAFLLRIGRKPSTTAEARFAAWPQVSPLGPEETTTLEIPARSTKQFEFDLAKLPLLLLQMWNGRTVEPGNGRVVMLSEFGRGSCTISFVDAEGQRSLMSEGIDLEVYRPAAGSQPSPASAPTQSPKRR